jgi:hypothetical protein
MKLSETLDQYARHIVRLQSKPPSVNRSKGIGYYMASAERVQALLEAPTPNWVYLQFKRSITL